MAIIGVLRKEEKDAGVRYEVCKRINLQSSTYMVLFAIVGYVTRTSVFYQQQFLVANTQGAII